ncbi:fibronectin type III domain-containing protein [Streptomyces corynorhini]|uniref:Fibronectin type III domain-containing protein n=1 Tax=Streptomyces corynorhini TaxID=2282652 RepID=A0A370B9S1_9ACTN|nr:fibronectin type III domain-containing protein [Streptomyces corynorhini]RDG38381.1 fibronectin type III domain-containing protein [Streptomyces corynorhini]
MPRNAALAALVPAALLLALAGCGADDEQPAQAPPAPAGVTAQAGSATSIHVMWKPVPENAGVRGYEVYRGGAKVKDVPAERNMIDVTGLKPSTPYTFTVRARGAEGALSPHSGDVPVTTPADVTADTGPPARPTGLRAKSDGPRGALLSWDHAEDGRGIVSYDILQGGARIHSVRGDATSARITRLRPGTHYRFGVTARDAADRTSPAGRTVEITTPKGPGDDPDTAPTAFRATTHTADGAHYADLSWLAPETGVDVPEYQIYLDGKFATTLAWGTEAPKGRAAYSVYVSKRAGETYRVKLRARLPDGEWGAFSAEKTFVTGTDRP